MIIVDNFYHYLFVLVMWPGNFSTSRMLKSKLSMKSCHFWWGRGQTVLTISEFQVGDEKFSRMKDNGGSGASSFSVAFSFRACHQKDSAPTVFGRGVVGSKPSNQI